MTNLNFLFFKALSNISPDKKWNYYHQLCYIKRDESSEINDSITSKPSPIININYSDLHDSEFNEYSSRENIQRSQINLAEELNLLPNYTEHLDSSHYYSEDLNKSLNKILCWWSPLKFFWDKIFWLIGLDFLIIPFYIRIPFDFLKLIMFARSIQYESSRYFLNKFFFYIFKLIIYKLRILLSFFVLIVIGNFFCILSIIFH